MLRFAILLTLATLCGCAGSGQDAGAPPSETVMSEGMRISATTPEGTIQIRAGKGFERTYTWEGATRSVEMWPRGDTRWEGSLGIYYPGPGEHWQNHNGITRGVLEEGQQHFETREQAMKWIDSRRKYMPYVYRDDGLVVGWRKTIERKQINVDVWQVYVGGVKPTVLPGSQDEKITVEFEPRRDSK